MNDINRVFLVGRLTRDADLRFTNSGTPVGKFAIAVNRSKKNGDKWDEEVNYFDIVLWGRIAEALSKYLLKGKQVAVEGELRQSRWEQDGQNRSRVEIHASNIQLLGGDNSNSGYSNQSYNNNAPQGQESSNQGNNAFDSGHSLGGTENMAMSQPEFDDSGIPFNLTYRFNWDTIRHERKICFKCKELKPLEEFYKHSEMGDGHLNKCKECAKKDTINARNNNIEYYREYDRQRDQLPHRVKARQEYYELNKDSEKYKEQKKKSTHKYVSENKEKRGAHIKLGNALRDGKIKRKDCVICGNEKSEAHHSDYSKPLDVIWLCHKCHSRLHAILNRNKKNN